MSSCLNTSEIQQHRQSPPHVVEFLHRVQHIVWNRHLVLGQCPFALPNDDLLLGLGPVDVREGDKICILYGCSVPVCSAL